jgi:hypothetical protein
MAVLGFFDVYGRNILKGAIGTDKLTLTVPMRIFVTMEEDADEGLLVIDTWRELWSEKFSTGSLEANLRLCWSRRP